MQLETVKVWILILNRTWYIRVYTLRYRTFRHNRLSRVNVYCSVTGRASGRLHNSGADGTTCARTKQLIQQRTVCNQRCDYTSTPEGATTSQPTTYSYRPVRAHAPGNLRQTSIYYGSLIPTYSNILQLTDYQFTSTPRHIYKIS